MGRWVEERERRRGHEWGRGGGGQRQTRERGDEGGSWRKEGVRREGGGEGGGEGVHTYQGEVTLCTLAVQEM